MWLSFWRPRNRFSIDELRYLTEQLEKVQVVNDVNKEFVIEALRSIAELITYGDQHDSSFFEFFMEKQIMGEFVRILRISQPVKVALQLLQTMSIMIQNLKSEHAIYYIFSNEHINYLITYSFDFHNDELLSYYISFLRAISVKLNKNTIPLLVKIQNDHVVSFPLYVEAIKFAFHEESMIRTAVRALTLNVYHVGDEYVNKYVSSIPQADYFSNLVKYFQKQCFALDGRVSKALGNPDSHDAISSILTMVDEIEDSLYFISDVISAGIPEIGKLITDHILQFLVFPSLLPSLGKQTTDKEISITTSLYLLCCVLRIVKTKELASSVAAALFLPPGVFIPKFDATANGSTMEQQVPAIPEQEKAFSSPSYPESKQRRDPCSLCHLNLQNNISNSLVSLRGMLLSYVVSGHDVQALGSLCLLATLLQTKELDESMLDGLGILPQRKQHKKLLLQALVGEESGEEQLFSPKNNRVDDRIDTELDIYLQKIQDHLQLSCTKGEPLTSPQKHRKEVLDALVCLFCRCNLSAETLWIGGWLLRQLLPHGEQEFTISHLQQLKDAHRDSIANLFGEARGTWCDILLVILKDEWKNCKRAIEGSSPLRDPKSILVPTRTFSSGGESSFAAGQRMSEIVKVFVLQQQLLIFSNGGYLAEQPPLSSPLNSPLNHRSETADFDAFAPKSGSEISAENAVPCRIAFERGKERHLSFLAISKGVSGWIILLEELQPNQRHGVVRVTAPLAGSNPRIDEKHPKWLHLRIRPSALSLLDPNHEPFARAKPKLLVDGRWTLAFRDDDACRSAQSMVIKELHQLQNQVEQMLKPFVDDQITTNSQNFLPNSSGELPEDAGR